MRIGIIEGGSSAQDRNGSLRGNGTGKVFDNVLRVISSISFGREAVALSHDGVVLFQGWELVQEHSGASRLAPSPVVACVVI